jgi:hypothetical protein
MTATTTNKSYGKCFVCHEDVTDPNCGRAMDEPIHMDGRGCFEKVEAEIDGRREFYDYNF